MPDLKEPGFFAPDVPGWRAVRLEEEYSNLFANSRGARIVGEASTIHLMSETAAMAIHDYNPQAKILIFLRNQEDYLPALHNKTSSSSATKFVISRRPGSLFRAGEHQRLSRPRLRSRKRSIT